MPFDSFPQKTDPSESVFRGISRSQYKPTLDEVDWRAFDIRESGKDDNGISVMRRGERSTSEMVQILHKSLLCFVSVEAVRKIDVTKEPALRGYVGSGFDVENAPIEFDTLHALIVGTPVGAAPRITRIRASELLAEIASVKVESTPDSS